MEECNITAVGPFAEAISKMEEVVLLKLADLAPDQAYRKWAIAKYTGIPDDFLTVVLRRLKFAGKVEIMPIWSEQTYRPDGSGYKLTDTK